MRIFFVFVTCILMTPVFGQWQYVNPSSLADGTGSSLLQTSVVGRTGGNNFYNNNWLYGTSIVNNWISTKYIDGISIDASFQNPTTSRSWWSRDAYNNVQSWGDQGNTYLTINQGNIGIGTSSPSYKLELQTLAPTKAAYFQTSGSWQAIDFSSDGGTSKGSLSAANSVLGIGSASSGTNAFMNINLNSGNVGIGTTSPSYKLELRTLAPTKAAYFQTSGSWQAIDFSSDGGTSKGSLSAANSVLGIGSASSGTNAFMNINLNSGNVGIGTASPNQKLTVNGTIYGKEVKVDLNVPGPDYVFDEGYSLPSLDSVQSYINQNKHLPEVPSAKEMEANGINLSEMNMLLLKKVEELTLYVIELRRENKMMREELNEIKYKQ